MAVDVKDKQLEIKKLQLEKKNNQYVFFLLCSVLLLFISFMLYRSINTQKKLNQTISKLVDEQEKTITQRTGDLIVTNNKLRALIQFNVHNLREPITRIMGLLMLRNDVGNEEFLDICIPMMEDSVNTLDSTLKEVIKSTENTQNQQV
jgi:light-regulated signal transduction histidine kinase (bacteriophytochrome)